jgi:hypothetical protein
LPVSRHDSTASSRRISGTLNATSSAEARRDPLGQRIQFGGSALDLGQGDAGLHPATPHPPTAKQKHFSNQEPAAIVFVSEL